MTLTAQDIRTEAEADLWGWFQPMWDTLSKNQKAVWVITFAESYKKTYRPDQVNDLFRKRVSGSIKSLGASGISDVKSRYTPSSVLEIMASKTGWSREKTVAVTAQTFPLSRYLRRADLAGANLMRLWRTLPDSLRAELLANPAVTSEADIVADARRLLSKGGRHCVLASPLFARGFVGGVDDAAFTKKLLKVAARSTKMEQGERFARLVTTSPHITMEEVESFGSLDLVKYARSDSDVFVAFDQLQNVEQRYVRAKKGSQQGWVLIDFPRLVPLATHLFANPTLTVEQRTRLTSMVFDCIGNHRQPLLSRSWSMRHLSTHSILLPSLIEAGLSDAELRQYYKNLTHGDGYSLLEDGYDPSASAIEDHLDAFPEATLDFLRDNLSENDGFVAALYDPEVSLGTIDALLAKEDLEAGRWRWIADNVKFFSYPLVGAALEALEEAKRSSPDSRKAFDLETVERPSLMMVAELTPAQAVKAVNDVICWKQAQAFTEKIAGEMGVDAGHIPREWLTLMA